MKSLSISPTRLGELYFLKKKKKCLKKAQKTKSWNPRYIPVLLADAPGISAFCILKSGKYLP